MNQHPIRLGPLALMLAIISICLTVLAVLNLSAAGADLRLAEKYASSVSLRYQLEKEGQELLSRLKEGAPPAELRQAEDGSLETTITREDAHLHIRLRPNADGRFEILSWKQEKDWTPGTELELWSGTITGGPSS